MNWSDFSGKSVALLGAGKENLSLISYLQKAGANLTVCDRAAVPELPRGVKLVSGENYLSGLAQFDYLLRSPGLPPREIEKALTGVTKRPTLTSPVDLFLAMYAGQTIGVTGTKGKGTTATMIAEIIRAAGRPVILAGNIGNSVFDEADKITDQTQIVMELSSFQLEDITHSPHIAVVLPITSEHLQPLSERSPNFHENLPSYINAKEQITAHQQADDTVIFSQESQASQQVGQAAVAKKISVGVNHPGDIRVEGKVVILPGEEKIDLGSIATLKGNHLYHNAAMASAVAVALNLDRQAIITGLNNFRPLPHRMQTVGTFGGVEYVDDSYATAPDATIAALSAFPDRPIVLILGGSKKGADFTGLAEVIAQSNIKAVILVGQEAPRLEEALVAASPQTPRLSGFAVFKDAVETAVHRSTSGDVVLLSPACASKDMFRDAAQRGEMFTDIVHELV